MPFGIESLPSELATLLRSLPLVAERLETIAESTSELPTMRAGIDAVGQDTDRLAGGRTPTGWLEWRARLGAWPTRWRR